MDFDDLANAIGEGVDCRTSLFGKVAALLVQQSRQAFERVQLPLQARERGLPAVAGDCKQPVESQRIFEIKNVSAARRESLLNLVVDRRLEGESSFDEIGVRRVRNEFEMVFGLKPPSGAKFAEVAAQGPEPVPASRGAQFRTNAADVP